MRLLLLFVVSLLSCLLLTVSASKQQQQQGHGRQLEVPEDYCDSNLVIEPLCDSDQQRCPKSNGRDGCPVGPYCFPQAHGDCPLTCPPICGDGEIFCLGVSVDGGCPSEHECLPLIDPDTGCTNHCAVQCGPGEHSCPGVRESKCNPPTICVASGESCPEQVLDEDGCPILRDQPTACGGGETLCPSGHDTLGCRLPDYCVALANTTDPSCTWHCPAACNHLFENPCPPTFDINGCVNEPTCNRFMSHCPTNHHDPLDGCPLTEIPECDSATEQVCSQDPVAIADIAADDDDLSNPDTVCYTDPVCQPKMMAGNHGHCPKHCPTDCLLVDNTGALVQKKKCPGVNNAVTGCPGPSTCVDPHQDCPSQTYDDQGCLIHDQKNCQGNQVLCDALYDEMGCEMEQVCIDDESCECPPQEFNDKGCPLDVPGGQCEDEESRCSLGTYKKLLI